MLIFLVYSDDELIVQLIDGDQNAFRELVESNQDKVINTCFSFVKNKEDAEDIAQEVFIEIHQSIAGFRKDAKLSTWIYRIAVNKSLDHIRKKKRKKRFAQLVFLDSTDNNDVFEIPALDDPEKELEDSDRRKVLAYAINQLTKNQKIALTLSKFEQLSNKEVASVLDSSVSAVEALIHRAKTNLRKKLQHYFEKQFKNARFYDE